jgi:hypothetical protein
MTSASRRPHALNRFALAEVHRSFLTIPPAAASRHLASLLGNGLTALPCHPKSDCNAGRGQDRAYDAGPSCDHCPSQSGSLLNRFNCDFSISQSSMSIAKGSPSGGAGSGWPTDLAFGCGRSSAIMTAGSLYRGRQRGDELTMNGRQCAGDQADVRPTRAKRYTRLHQDCPTIKRWAG